MASIINEAMKIERKRYLYADDYQRTAEKIDYANGYKPRTPKTRMGELNLAVPQTRDSGFYPSCLEHGIRRKRALTVALMEMYIQGVSTRKINMILEKMCGFEISPTHVSRIATQLDGEL